MAKIHVDGKVYEVSGAENLLQACLSLGLDIPYFCWHPALGSVGACRQCAVKQFKDEHDQHGKLVMSCMTPVSDNSFISIGDAEAQEFRKSVVEWLMVNHPHDCPVCEEGGHCHLQDMTVMAGHTQRRYRFQKRTHRNQELGPFVAHEMNRCIACYRCVRYYRDYAGGKDLGVFGAAEDVYFGRAEDGVLESEFSGNLTEVCPTGVFTDKTHSERYTRKWDMQFAPSVCAHCSVGCNISPGERYGEIRRIENRYHGEINGYFLCDRGRFGYGYVNERDRPRRPQLRRGERLEEVTPAVVLAELGAVLRGGRKLVGIGSPRASLEANFALRQLVGAENFSTGMAAHEQKIVAHMLQVLRQGPAQTASLSDVELSDAVLVLGEDVTQTAPRLALAIRQAAQGKALEVAAQRHIPIWQADAVKDAAQGARHPVFVAAVGTTRLDDIAAKTYRAAPQELARLGYAIAHAIDAAAPAVADLADAVGGLAQEIAQALKGAKRPLIVAGSGAAQASLIDAAANVAWALHAQGIHAQISLLPADANSFGVGLMGGLDVETALARAATADTLVVLENDLYRRLPAEPLDAALGNTQRLIVLDHMHTATTARAAALLPAASVFEGDGTLVNQEGRAQRHFQVFDPAAFDKSVATQESWRWIEQLLEQIGGAVAPDWKSFDEVSAACAAEIDALAKITESAPSARFRMRGMKLARAPHRYSGRTAMRAHLSVHEPRATQDPDTALAFSMEGYAGTARPAPLIPFVWAPSWNSPQALNKFQDEVGGPMRGGDPGVRLIEPTVAAAKYFRQIPAPFSAGANGLRGIVVHNLFNNEELSVRAKPIQARAPAKLLVLNPKDAARLKLETGDQVQCKLAGSDWQLAVAVDEALPIGMAGLPGELAGLQLSGVALEITPQLAEVEV
ncbi:MAG: NADH-quinone oxidoreductase subunit NuoG [Nevskiales bacterium]